MNAPAVLLCLDFAHSNQQIAQFGGRPECAEHERSLYPYFFSAAEETGIIARLRRVLPCNPLPHRGAAWPPLAD